MIYPLNATSQSIDVQVVDDTGLPVTALVAATFPPLIYSLAGANADVAFPALSDLGAITTAWSAGGIKERGNGVYRVDLPNGVFGSTGEVKIRGEASGKHVIAPWIDVLADLRVVDGDWSVDTTTTPWDVVCTVKGTGLPASMGGTGIEILRKRVRDVTGANITNTTTVPGQEIQ